MGRDDPVTEHVTGLVEGEEAGRVALEPPRDLGRGYAGKLRDAAGPENGAAAV